MEIVGTALLFCLALWLAVGAVAAWDLRRRGESRWKAVFLLIGGVVGAVYWTALRARSEI